MIILSTEYTYIDCGQIDKRPVANIEEEEVEEFKRDPFDENQVPMSLPSLESGSGDFVTNQVPTSILETVGYCTLGL